MLRHGAQRDLKPFLDSDGEAVVLVCDQSAEEGLNLQSVAVQIVHLDLPIAPNRVEQRIGRVDRFGARARAQSIVFRTSDPIIGRWNSILGDVVGVFDESSASLQCVDIALSGFWTNVFGAGAEAVDALRARLRSQGCRSQLSAGELPYRTSWMAFTPKMSTRINASKNSTTSTRKTKSNSRLAFDSWASRRLGFHCLWERDHGKASRYKYSLNRNQPTQLSVGDFVQGFASSIDPDAGVHYATGRLTFSRPDAVRHGTGLARAGHPFVDGVFDLTRRDDRGVAHLLWRTRPAFTTAERDLCYLRLRFSDRGRSHQAPGGAARPCCGCACPCGQQQYVSPRIHTTVLVDQEHGTGRG